jgi:hypothetical protein
LAAYPDQDDLHPEKQHIIPFSLAKKIAGKGGTRSTASKANAIGNLTWISARQNGFEHGLSDRWTVFDESVDLNNLEARGMLAVTDDGGPSTGKRALDLYRKIQSIARDSAQLERSEWPETFGGLYDDFRRARTSWMKQQMKTWLEVPLSGASRQWLLES